MGSLANVNSAVATSIINQDQLREKVAEQFPEIQSILEDLVRIPSVSAPAFDQEQVETSAAVVADLFRVAGFDDVRINRSLKNPESGTAASDPMGAPAIIARRAGALGAPTVMLYAHHDVQPPGEGWETDPFVPTQRGERLFGRGAADDKAGIVAHLGAIRALTALNALPNIGIVVFIEGEEEIGSPSFENFLHDNRELLKADVIVVADSGNWQIGVPGLTTSLRGLVDGIVEVSVLDHAVHSGMFGGPVLDANVALARLISTLHDDTGNVAVAGLYQAPEPSVDYDEADFRNDSSLLSEVELAGTGSITSRLWAKPAISVIGIDATPIAKSANVMAPTSRAKISMRIPAGETPASAAAALEKHLLSHAPFGARVTWQLNEAGNPFQAPADSPAMQAARRAFAASWGVDPVDIGIGGSIPFIAHLLAEYPNAEILVTGVEDPDSRAHGANESVHLGELQKVIMAEALLLIEIAQLGTAS